MDYNEFEFEGVVFTSHKPSLIKIIEDCITLENKLCDVSLYTYSDFEYLKKVLSESIVSNSIHFCVRGNGFCVLNSVIAILPKLNTNVSQWSYQSILDIFKMFLCKYGFIESNPNVIPADIACMALRDLLKTFEINDASFLILDLELQVIKFDFVSTSHQNDINLFCMIYKSGHFSGLYLNECQRRELFHKNK